MNINNNIFTVLEKKSILHSHSPIIFLLFISCVILFLPLQVNADDGNNNNVIFRINSGVTVEIDEVYKTIISLNGPVDISGWVTGSVISVGKPVYVQGIVEGDVINLGSDIVLTEGSAIRGNAVTIGGEILQSYGSMIGGNIKEINNLPSWNFQRFPERIPYFMQQLPFYFGFVLPENFLVFRIIFMLLIATLVVALLPKQVMTVAESIKYQPWKNFFIGLLGVICMVPITGLLGIALVGIPLIPVIIVLFILAGYIGGIAINYIVGHRILSAFNNSQSAPIIWCVFSGLFIMEILKMMPVITAIVLPLLYLLGLGGVIYTRFGSKSDKFV